MSLRKRLAACARKVRRLVRCKQTINAFREVAEHLLYNKQERSSQPQPTRDLLPALSQKQNKYPSCAALIVLIIASMNHRKQRLLRRCCHCTVTRLSRQLVQTNYLSLVCLIVELSRLRCLVLVSKASIFAQAGQRLRALSETTLPPC